MTCAGTFYETINYGYLAILLGTALEGETVLIMGGFTAHRGYLDLLAWVILSGFAGNDIQNQVVFLIGRRYGVRVIEKHPEWKPRLQQVHGLMERFGSSLVIGLRFVPRFRTVSGVAMGMSGVTLSRKAH